jgi:hypothetical protein
MVHRKLTADISQIDSKYDSNILHYLEEIGKSSCNVVQEMH